MGEASQKSRRPFYRLSGRIVGKGNDHCILMGTTIQQKMAGRVAQEMKILGE